MLTKPSQLKRLNYQVFPFKQESGEHQRQLHPPGTPTAAMWQVQIIAKSISNPPMRKNFANLPEEEDRYSGNILSQVVNTISFIIFC